MTFAAAGWQEKNLGEICTFKYGKSLPQTTRKGGDFSVYGSNGVVGLHDAAITTGQTIVIGRKGSYGEINYSKGPCWPIDTAYFVDETSTKQDIKWLSYRLASLGLNQLNKAAAVPGLNREDAYRQLLLVPPLPEQRRIAAILDQADALRAKRRDALAQLDSLTQSIFIEMFGDPARNSLDLPLASLSELGSWHSGGTPPRGDERYFNGDIPWFSSGELETMYVSASTEHISEEAVRQTSAKLVPSGALMLGMYDTAALKASITTVDCSCNQAIAFAKIRSEIAETVYVYYAIIVGREHFRRLQRGVRQKNLNLSMIRDIQIPAPSIEQQRVFSMRVQSLETIKSVHRIALSELNNLFASLQHRAFRGEL